ncbi:hypothetical protein QFZ66_004899 [Streptomyces sp. B4I13]|uniref:hypothetical protein n=1 Tax=Streptomyces sp. B4I13 TaxID=3042271 RepID=UPI002781887A|nr:hypothetical protein [Streptomyces sp. B4I13]MDQ0961021.1 hypothetical protein [Streptomyces sp. B4I13]
MSTFYEYFSAPDDEAAFTDLFWRQVEERPLSPLSVKGLGPYVELGQGQSLLTGVPYDEIIRLPRFCRFLTDEASEQVLVTVTDELRDAVATDTPDRFREVAEPWSRIEEFSPGWDPESLVKFLTDLAEVAVPARAAGHHLYCEFSM